MSQSLSNQEVKYIKYYTGDISGNDSFWSEPKAYLVLNSLLYDGIETEISRTREGKFLNPAILSDVERLLDFYDNMFSAFEKSRADTQTTAYRVERYSDYLPVREKNRTISFTSTSTGGFLDSYRDRKGIALIKFKIPAGTHCIDMSKSLDYYAKSHEREILLPPFMEIKITEKNPTDKELSITDSSGKPPVVSCVALCGKWNITSRTKNLTADGAFAGQRIYEALNNNNAPDKNDTEIYIRWKATLQNLYKNCCT